MELRNCKKKSIEEYKQEITTLLRLIPDEKFVYFLQEADKEGILEMLIKDKEELKRFRDYIERTVGNIVA